MNTAKEEHRLRQANAGEPTQSRSGWLEAAVRRLVVVRWLDQPQHLLLNLFAMNLVPCLHLF